MHRLLYIMLYTVMMYVKSIIYYIIYSNDVWGKYGGRTDKWIDI